MGQVMKDTEPWTYDERREGEASERICARLLQAGLNRPTSAQLLRAVNDDPLLAQPHHQRLAARQRLGTRVSLYFAVLGPDFSRWRFVEHQPQLGGARGDLLFTSATGTWQVDELKSGRLVGAAEERAEEQAVELMEGGVATFGTQFVAVRVLFLAAPTRSYVLTRAGQRYPVLKGIHGA